MSRIEVWDQDETPIRPETVFRLRLRSENNDAYVVLVDEDGKGIPGGRLFTFYVGPEGLLHGTKCSFVRDDLGVAFRSDCLDRKISD